MSEIREAVARAISRAEYETAQQAGQELEGLDPEGAHERAQHRTMETSTMHPHGSYYATLDESAITRLREIYDFYNIPTIINARNLDFHWRKDALTGMKEADAIKDLLRYMPAILAKLAANPDPAAEYNAVEVPDILAAQGDAKT